MCQSIATTASPQFLCYSGTSHALYRNSHPEESLPYYNISSLAPPTILHTRYSLSALQRTSSIALHILSSLAPPATTPPCQSCVTLHATRNPSSRLASLARSLPSSFPYLFFQSEALSPNFVPSCNLLLSLAQP